MTKDDFTIQPKSADLLVYDEREGRTIEFGCRTNIQPPIVWAPASETWQSRTPAWAHERRQQIIERLRQAGYVVYEQGVYFTTILSPDRTFRVELESEPDERGPDLETTSIVLTESGRRIVYLPMFGFEGAIEFPAPGDLVMAMHRRHGERFVVHVNVTAQTYRLNANEPEQPLAGLPDRVGLTAKPVIALPAVPVLRPGAREQVWNAFVGFIGLIFVAGGVWMAFTGKTAKDRFVGILGILLFGAAALVSIRDLGRMGAASRNPAANNRYAGIRPRWRVMPYVPLMIVGVELLWIVFVIAVFIFMVGDSRYESTPAKSRLMSAVMGLPAVGGVMLGIVGIIFRWAATKAEWICLILGGVICALFAVGFVWGSFH